MAYLSELFPVILYFVLIILVIVLIVLVVRVIETLKKVNQIVDDVNQKVNKLNGFFDMVDMATDTLSVMSDKIVSSIANGITKLFSRKKKNREEDENE